MIYDGNELTESHEINADLCVIGCGVAGTVLATELSTRFPKIAVMETGSESFDIKQQELYAATNTHPIYPDPRYTRLRMLGGSSNHWENNTSPFDPIDFEKRDWVPDSGWPISYADLEPYYKEAAIYCGAGRQGYDYTHWQAATGHRAMTDKSDKVTTGISIFSTPPVRFFQAYGEAFKNSNSVDIYKHSCLVDIEYDENKAAVQSAVFINRKSARYQVKARIFVLCLGGIENARMLLHANQKYNNKLGNRSGALGRYFMDHPVVEAAHFYPSGDDNFDFYKENKQGDYSVSGYFKVSDKQIRDKRLNNIRVPLIPRDNFYLSDGVSSFHILKDSFREGDIPDYFGTHIVNFIKDIDMVAEGISRKKFDTKLFDDAKKIEAYMMYMMIEQTPSWDNKISLSDQLDTNGVPKIKIDWALKQSDVDNIWQVLEILARDFGQRSLGRLKTLKERSERIFTEHLGFASHHMGTTRMANKAENGVVDANLRVFGSENLFVTGSSPFVTGGHVPPTLTLVALTIRLAKHLTEEYKYHD